MNARPSSRPPVCGKGHTIAPAYTVHQVRTLDVLVFHCEVCDERWNASPEERDAFLAYLEEHSDEAVPP